MRLIELAMYKCNYEHFGMHCVLLQSSRSLSLYRARILFASVRCSVFNEKFKFALNFSVEVKPEKNEVFRVAINA